MPPQSKVQRRGQSGEKQPQQRSASRLDSLDMSLRAAALYSFIALESFEASERKSVVKLSVLDISLERIIKSVRQISSETIKAIHYGTRRRLIYLSYSPKE
jgi:hypothetical protein